MHVHIDTQWFRGRIADRKLSQRRLAGRLQMDPAALSLALRGRRALKLNEAADMARELGVPVAELLEHAGVEHAANAPRVPLAGIAGADCAVRFRPDLGMVTAPGIDLPHIACAVVCRTFGGRLEYMDGWTLYVGLDAKGGSAEHLQRLCLVRIEGHPETLLAQLRRSPRAGHWGLNGPALPDADGADVRLAWSAPVLAIRT